MVRRQIENKQIADRQEENIKPKTYLESIEVYRIV